MVLWISGDKFRLAGADHEGETTPVDEDPYTRMNEGALIPRDWLAIDRTHLANERTLLAYVRTAITLFLVGMSFIHLPYFHPNPEIDADWYTLFGWVLVGVSLVVFAIGVQRFNVFRRKLRQAGTPKTSGMQ